MLNRIQHFINGEWVDSTDTEIINVINPANKKVIGKISDGTTEDLNRAVKAAKNAFLSFSKTTKKERITLLNQIADEFEKRKKEIVDTITLELGSPISNSYIPQFSMALAHYRQAAKELEDFEFVEYKNKAIVYKEPIGVSGLITPWNFPANQASTKIASAIASGSTVVLKPAQLTPFTAMIIADVFKAAGAPKGVFNLVNGSGKEIGNGISSHPDIDFVSFTGSGAVGQKITENAAKTVKKVSLELGGKSPLIVLKDCNIEKAVDITLSKSLFNSGQVCTAAAKIIIPEAIHDDFVKVLKKRISKFKIGDPQNQDTLIGPLVSEKQFNQVQKYIDTGIKEGANLIIGGKGHPEGFEGGFYARPTVFTNVNSNMSIAQEEIFGPVIPILSYEDIPEAIKIANDTIYGLAGYVIGNDKELAQETAISIRAGRVTINDAPEDYSAPFGGYKQSGVGREWGKYGIEEYLELKAILTE